MLAKSHLLAAAAATLALGLTAPAANAADIFTLKSTTFADGHMMPKKVANNAPNNPNCVGDNVSPELSWTGVPEGTKSLVLTMFDPEGRAPSGVKTEITIRLPSGCQSACATCSARVRGDPPDKLTVARVPPQVRK